MNNDIRNQMNEIIRNNTDERGVFDEEIAHEQADDLLCKVLLQYGEEELVKWFEKLPKYYS